MERSGVPSKGCDVCVGDLACKLLSGSSAHHIVEAVNEIEVLAINLELCTGGAVSIFEGSLLQKLQVVFICLRILKETASKPLSKLVSGFYDFSAVALAVSHQCCMEHTLAKA